MVYAIVILITLLALGLAVFNFRYVRGMKEGTAEMSEMAGVIRDGANVFMCTEYKTIVITMAAVAVIFLLLIEWSSAITFVLGAAMSSAACIFGMKAASYANVRTANRARSGSMHRTMKVALRGGSVSGLSVQAFGLLGLVLILLVTGGVKIGAVSSGLIVHLECNPSIMRLTTYSLGCSIVAMFNRVAGGNFTKAADISADIIGKNRHDLPEDDRRVPNTIADFIGDLVNDIAGNCSDLLESFVATIVAAILIAVSVMESNAISVTLFKSMYRFPILLAGIGLLGCIVGILTVLKSKSGKSPSATLDKATYISAGFVVVGAFLISLLMFFGEKKAFADFRLGWISPWLSTILGLISGVAIGKITEYYTSTDHKPVQKLAEISVEGEAFVVTKGDAIGSRSCLLPIAVIVASLLLAGWLCGIYGIAISALGMLSFVATTVSVDAFGPIADNAGGIAEACHLDESVRAITDKLDAVGNTTAAIGKGFAIGSAAFATVSLIFAYVGSYSSATTPVLNIASFAVIGGALFGGALIEFFSAKLTDNTIDSARMMADEGDRQLNIPGVLEGEVKPDYNACIEMAAKEALRKMLFPSLLALLVPAIGVVLLGLEFVGGILIGATIVAIPRAIFMGNSGGAFDNAKKYVESGLLEGHGKGSPAHKAAVTGDTVGDTRKDVVGVALDIFIKMMSTVANTLAPVFSALRH